MENETTYFLEVSIGIGGRVEPYEYTGTMEHLTVILQGLNRLTFCKIIHAEINEI